MPANISKIVIAIGGDEKTLSLDEARELRNALNDLLGTPMSSPVQIVERLLYPTWPHRYAPYWTVSAVGTTGCKVALETAHVQGTTNNASLTN